MRSTAWTKPALAGAALAAALLGAAPVAAQSGGRSGARTAAVPGWIGFFAGIEQGASAAHPTIVVMAVADGSPAARAGLAEGDTVLALDGVTLTLDGLKALQAGLHAGDRHVLTLRGGGQSRTLAIRAERRPATPPAMPEPPEPVAAAAVQTRTSLRVQAVTVAAPTLPDAGQATPFALHVFGDARTDSLASALKSIEERLQAARAAEQLRARQLATRPQSGGRGATPDSELAQLRAHSQTLTAEAALLRGTLEQIVTERVGSPFGMDALNQWTIEVTPAVDPFAASSAAPTAPAAVVRPLTPYLAGWDRVAGARLTPLNAGLAEYFGTPRGVLVVEVADGTPAQEAALRAGDVLLKVGGVEVDDLDPIRRAIAGARDDEVPITVWRKGKRVELKLPR